MGLLLKLAGKVDGWPSVANQLSTTSNEWISTLLNAINWVLWVALILVGAVGAVYAIFIGIKMARAESSDQREEAKKHLINVIVAIVVAIALILFFNTLLPVILNELGVFDSLTATTPTP